MDTFTVDIAIVGAGGADLRAAIAVTGSHPSLSVALISKVYPMRSHTVAAEGGAAAADQRVEVASIDAVAAMERTGNPALRSTAQEVRRLLTNVLPQLGT
jgi:succinate dehydrogenase/fumarate reductase flavoprotein subunit